ncbi:hypothetical protein [Mucilaginibacter mallensis]|nr:hypothetical protein [Mucilaginibacter mallensis]
MISIIGSHFLLGSNLNIEPGVFAALLVSFFQSPGTVKVIVDVDFFS